MRRELLPVQVEGPYSLKVPTVSDKVSLESSDFPTFSSFGTRGPKIGKSSA